MRILPALIVDFPSAAAEDTHAPAIRQCGLDDMWRKMLAELGEKKKKGEKKVAGQVDRPGGVGAPHSTVVEGKRMPKVAKGRPREFEVGTLVHELAMRWPLLWQSVGPKSNL